MTRFDVRSAKTGITARIPVDDDLDEDAAHIEALNGAVDLDLIDDDDEVSVMPSRPVGWDGGDAEDAIAEGESLDNGDHV